MCSSSSSTAETGTIYDSGGSGSSYTNDENCGFLIQPSTSPTSITLNFSQFSVDNGSDYLYVYDGTSSSGTLLGVFTGYSIPSSETATSGSMYLQFTSDNVYTYSGFSASWTSTTGSSSCDNVEDDFSSLSYSNNDGTQNWTNSWQETGESDGVSAGKVRVRNDLCTSGYCLRLGTPSEVSPSSYSNRGAIRQTDLTDATSATLSFNYFTEVNSGSSTVTLSVSNNGGSSWTSLKTYTISSTNFSANPESFDISAYASANTQIRFLTSGSSSSVTGMYIDDIKIDYCQTTPATTILEYKFDACSLASTVEDSQGSYDGIATGTDSTDSTSVLGGRSLDLSGTSTSDWVTVPKSAITGLTDLSFSVWIKTGTTSKQQEIFQALGSDDDDELGIYIKNKNKLIFKIKDKHKILSAGTSLTNNIWHHLVLTRQSDTICLYVDGSQTDCDNGAKTGTLSVSYTNSVVIGQEQDSTRNSADLNSGFDSSQSFKGYIDELKIYDSALSSSQVQTLYSHESSGDNTSSCEADLIASYNFDDDWVTNNSLTDQTGGYDGNPSGSVSQVSAGANGSKGDTCYAGSFSGGDIDITGLPVSTSTGATTSVSFWMYWDGTNNVMPMGWYQHDLWLYRGAFGYNTWKLDVYGISSSGLSSGWHHVAAVFTNGSVSNNKLYIDGTLQSMSQYYSTPNASSAIVQSALTIGGLVSDGFFNFRGLIDNFKVYDGTITQTQVTADRDESNACPSVDTPAVAFNCVENDSDGISGKLYTKTTAQSFSFDIVALRDSSIIETSFADGADHTVTVELVDSSSGESCSAYAALSPAVSQSLLLTSTDAGKKASASMNSSTAYSSVACRVTDATDSPTIVGCSTDSFSIRPTDFTLTSNLVYTDPTSTPTAKAGDNFTLTATTNSGYTGTPEINTTKLEAHSGAVRTGTLTGSFNTAVAGVATNPSFAYNEVGAIRFAAEGIYDDTFTSVDSSTECTDDFSNTVISKKVGCKFGNTATTDYFGRFIPSHFDISLNIPEFSPACSTFTYLGQPFKYATNPIVTITAKDTSGTSITKNYTGDFWKINSAILSLAPVYSEATYSLNVLDSNTPIVTDSGILDSTKGGTGLLTYADTSNNIVALIKGALSAPYAAEIGLSFSLTDTDSITVANVDGTAQTNPINFGAATSGNGIGFNGANNTHLWGRVIMSNVHGSELSPLSIPLTTEYYSGTSFIQNTNDSCTSFTLATDFSISDPADFNCSFATQSSPVAVGSGSVKATLSSTTVSNGVSELLISDNTSTSNGPGDGNTGYIELTSNLSNLSWLWYDWDTDGTHDNCPSARATFGIYKGNTKQIYFREVF